MKSILEKIVALRGVHYACIYQSGDVLATSFPEEKEEGISNATRAIEQMFFALQVIGKAHNEVYFSMPERLLIAYLLDDDCLVVLLTDVKINQPLIHMGVKSASIKIKALLSKLQQLPPKEIPSLIQEAPELQAKQVSVSPPQKTIIINSEMQRVMDQYKELLMDYLGPAATFVFDDGVVEWKEHSIPAEDTLINLAEILGLELNSGDERNDFMEKAKGSL
jgi:predicted regulator of Ras-like GTPase activity (Roadblock/LC7/MglB family)